ncbi:MAG: Zn-ribbon domain-containing OB-fold protein, partial [Candidatus Geothermincolia bacterium]
MSEKLFLNVESGAEAEQPFHYAAGSYGSVFINELRDNKKLMGIKCPNCGKVYVPPRRVCPPCFTEMTELVEVSSEGELYSFTVVSFGFLDPSTGREKAVPYTYAVFKLDGADNTFLHFLDETDHAKIKLGSRVKAVFEEERAGGLLDIKHFTLV